MIGEHDGTLGLAQLDVRLAEPSPVWAVLFDEEAGRLTTALGAHGAVIEHCGSTSVRAIPAKPILDILIGVVMPVDIPAIAQALAPLGYERATWAGVPGHEVFGKGTPRTHLLHVVPANGTAWRRMLQFRDALRANPRLAAEYAALKRALAEQFPANRPAYTAGKTEFVARVLGEAIPPAI